MGRKGWKPIEMNHQTNQHCRQLSQCPRILASEGEGAGVFIHWFLSVTQGYPPPPTAVQFTSASTPMWVGRGSGGRARAVVGKGDLRWLKLRMGYRHDGTIPPLAFLFVRHSGKKAVLRKLHMEIKGWVCLFVFNRSDGLICVPDPQSSSSTIFRSPPH